MYSFLDYNINKNFKVPYKPKPKIIILGFF